MHTHRGLSQIIGSLIILGTVASIGSVILFHGLDELSAFSYDLSVYDESKNEAIREDLVFEHIRFEPNSNNMSIYLTNVGSIESSLSSVTVVKIDTQEMIVDWKSIDSIIGIKNSGNFVIAATLDMGNETWDDPYYKNSQYRISITTVKGNFFSTIGKPFNT